MSQAGPGQAERRGSGAGSRRIRGETGGERRLLAVSAFPPWPTTNGYSLRVANLVDGLVDTWRVTLVSPAVVDPGGWPDAPELARWIQVPMADGVGRLAQPREEWAPLRAAVEGVLREGGFDASLLWGGTEFLAFDLPDLPPAVWERIDSLTLQKFRVLGKVQSPVSWLRELRSTFTLALLERRTVGATCATTVVGEEDAAMLRRLAPRCADRVHVSPNGVRLRSFADYALAAGERTVAFTGHLSYPPNVEAARHFVRHVWPRVRARFPEARMVIAGRSPQPRVLALARQRGVTVEADVPSMEAVLSRAWVVVAPMRSGSGIKNKVLEAWAVGRPVVMYPLASNGLRISGSLSDLIVERPGEMAERVTRLLDSRSELEAYAAAAHEAAGHHGWDLPVKLLDALLEQSIEGSSRRASTA